MRRVWAQNWSRVLPKPSHIVRRTLTIAAVIFGLVIGAVTVTAWLEGEGADELPFEYEGFD
ncbi:MAG: hypothetical protein V3T01_09905 [Myxococcota bacterium]|jgi:hypothetical protein